jgi:hypothetical protein
MVNQSTVNDPVLDAEEEVYAEALAELKSASPRPGLWAKAFAESDGNENKSQALYIRLRVQAELERRRREQAAAQELGSEIARQKAEAFSALIEQLRLNGYRAERAGDGWRVHEPLGGRAKLASDEALVEYAQGRVRQDEPECNDAQATRIAEMERLVESAIAEGTARDRRDLTGKTLLHLAAQCGAVKAVDRLLQVGADPNAPDGCGYGPLYYAEEAGERAIVATLRKVGAKVTPLGIRTRWNDEAPRDPPETAGREKPIRAPNPKSESNLSASPAPPISQPRTRETPGEATASHGLPDAALWEAAVGKNSRYYLPRFSAFHRSGNRWRSWHWPALFIPVWWALYRKLWGAAAFFYFLPFLIFILAAVGVGASGPNNDVVSGAILVACLPTNWFLSAIIANGWYYGRTKARVEEAKTRFPERVSQLAYLAVRGGTGGAAFVVIGILAFIMLLGVLAAIALPAYQDYVLRAKVSETLAALQPLKQQVEDQWARYGSTPEELDLRSLPNEGRYIGSVRYDRNGGCCGSIFIRFTGVESLEGKTVSMAFVAQGRPDLSVTWVCRNVDAPERLLPRDCRTHSS